MDPQLVQLLPVFANLGGTGILAGILYFLLRETRKEARDDRASYKEEMENERKASRNEAKEDRDALVKEMQAERAQCASQWRDLLEITHTKLTDAKDKILEAVRQGHPS